MRFQVGIMPGGDHHHEGGTAGWTWEIAEIQFFRRKGIYCQGHAHSEEEAIRMAKEACHRYKVLTRRFKYRVKGI